MSSQESLSKRLLSYQTALHDNSDVYAGDALKHGKGLDKAKKGREKLANGDSATPLVVVDSTIWGSVSEGFFITENYIYGKELYEDRQSFRIEDISSIYVDEKEKSLVIDNVSIKWLGESTTPKMKIIAQCIQEHLDQRIISARKEGFAQGGEESHFKRMQLQLFAIQTDLTKWNMRVMREISESLQKVYISSPMGMENFLERAAIRVARSQVIDNYKKIRKEVKEKISSINNNLAVKDANEQLAVFSNDELYEEHDLEIVVFSFDLGSPPDEDTKLANEDWDRSAEKALERLQDCAESLIEQVEGLIKKIEIIIEGESED